MNAQEPVSITEQAVVSEAMTRSSSEPPLSFSAESKTCQYEYLARLLLLAATFVAAVLLNQLVTSGLYLSFVILGGLAFTAAGLFLAPEAKRRSIRLAIFLIDLSWISFAIYFTKGVTVELNSFVLPLLYIIVALATMRGDRWDTGIVLAGATLALFLLAFTSQNGNAFAAVAAQVTLLGAATLAVRLVNRAAVSCAPPEPTIQLYEWLQEKTATPVLILQPENWRIVRANPAAKIWLSNSPETPIEGQSLQEFLQFSEQSFLSVCQETLAQQQPVTDAYAQARDAQGHDITIRCHMLPLPSTYSASVNGSAKLVQAIFEVVPPEEQELAPTAARSVEFAINYLPSLTHELNNHLAAIRLSAELAATTGKLPDFEVMQQQVDHCQNVLQTIILQIMRMAAPRSAAARPAKVDLRDVVERALLLTRPQVLANGLQVQLDIPEAVPPIKGLAYELQEALVRIILQAVARVSKDKDAPRMLNIALKPREQTVNLIISDWGTPLSMREKAVLSGKLVDVSRFEDHPWEAVREMLTRFGGEVQASNGLQGGMRIHISLPIFADSEE